jgi:hypothetical protein
LKKATEWHPWLMGKAEIADALRRMQRRCLKG